MNFLPVIISGTVAFLVTGLMGIWVIPMLRKLKFGQTILDIGPRWHKNKEGTPTMGGILFIIGSVAGVIAGYGLLQLNLTKDLFSHSARNNRVLLLGVVMTLAFAAVGFLDDYIKVVKKRNLGLTEKQKLVLQFAIAIAYIVCLSIMSEPSTIVWFPFIGQINLGWVYYPLTVLGIVFIVNAVNFTDGVDGLCASVTFMSALGLLVIAGFLQFAGMQMLAASLAGGCLGFLVWNLYPAKVFMGDTGSFFLGGMIVALAFGLGVPLILILTGFIYIVEAVTVMIQTSYFKYTRRKYGEGKRLFKMTPIHHHFEMSGWSESRIVVTFSLIQVGMCVIAVLSTLTM